MICSQYSKTLSKKSARIINGKLMCSACLFPKLKKAVVVR